VITDAIQPDYGGFDPRFLGVMIRFQAPSFATWDLFQRIHAGDPNPAEIVRLGNAALQEPPDRAFQVFAASTVLVHELRHFHDFLLSPYGNTLFRLRLTTVLNGLRAIGPLLGRRGTVPVPLTTWIEKSPQEQNVLASLWAALLRPRAFRAPRLGPASLQLLRACRATYQSIQNLLVNPDTQFSPEPFQPAHLFEASAALVQEQNVYTMFGAPHRELFSDVLMGDSRIGAYSLVLRTLYPLWNQAGRLADSELVGAIVTWSILGDFLNDGLAASPSVRFARLLHLLRSEGRPPKRKPVDRLFEDWNRRLGYTPWPASLERNLASSNKMLMEIQGHRRDSAEVTAAVDELLPALEGLVAASRHMAAAFGDNMRAYVNPYRYLENLRLWAAAPIMLNFEGGGPVKETLFPEDMHVRKAKEIEPGSGKYVVYSAVLRNQTDGERFIAPQAAAEVADRIMFADFFLSGFRRDDPDFDLVREAVHGDGTVTLEIME
jgi:hypothetical protein